MQHAISCVSRWARLILLIRARRSLSYAACSSGVHPHSLSLNRLARCMVFLPVPRRAITNTRTGCSRMAKLGMYGLLHPVEHMPL